MTAATNTPKSMAGNGPAPDLPMPDLSINDLVLLRIAAASTTRAELQRDLAALVAPKIPGTAFRRSAELAIGQHSARHLLAEHRGRMTLTETGQRAAKALLAPTKSSAAAPLTDWPGIRSVLAVRALGLKAATPAILKALNRPEGIAALVLQQHFELAADKVLSPTTLRSELAVVALERAFGNKIKTGLGKGTGLPGKAGRILAGQLFKQPREITTDGKLVLALAAEIAGAPDTSLDGLTLAVLRSLTQAALTGTAIATLEQRLPKPSPTADNDASPLPPPAANAAPPQMRPAVRPDMSEFASAVVSAARPVSEGWPGNRKAFISLVWNAIRNTRPEWELSEIAFKGMLAEAHRIGLVVLAGADLKDKCDLKELEDSKILYKNTVWHFVRVED
jgi:hypothetical protein